MGKLKIQVTKDDIANGMRLSPKSCPIALAIKRAVGDAYVSVGNTSFQVGNASRYSTPTMQKFTRAFDQYKPVKPFTIIVNLP